jgi:hypothetical protein
MVFKYINYFADFFNLLIKCILLLYRSFQLIAVLTLKFLNMGFF